MSPFLSILDSYRKRTNSFIRFLLVGVLNTLVGLSTIFILLNSLGFSYYISTFVGNGIGAMVSFFLNRTFTFDSGTSIKAGAPKFIAVILFCYYCAYTISSIAAGWLVPNLIGIHMISEKEIAVLLGTIIYTILNYLGQKYFVFKALKGV